MWSDQSRGIFLKEKYYRLGQRKESLWVTKSWCRKRGYRRGWTKGVRLRPLAADCKVLQPASKLPCSWHFSIRCLAKLEVELDFLQGRQLTLYTLDFSFKRTSLWFCSFRSQYQMFLVANVYVQSSQEVGYSKNKEVVEVIRYKLLLLLGWTWKEIPFVCFSRILYTI